jgi:polysaccharide export outer membrane protein
MNAARGSSIDPRMRSRLIAFLLLVACAAPPPHYSFVMPQPSADTRLAPGDTATPRVLVLGEINAPGALRFHGGLTVVGAIVDSGGFTSFARRDYVVVKRTVAGKASRFVISIDAVLEGAVRDLPLMAGDEILVEGRYV